MRTVVLGLALAAVGCGNGANGGDLGAPDLAVTGDGGAPDLAFDPVTNGTPLVTGTTHVLLDTTTDDYAIVNTAGNVAGPLLAVKLDDGTQQTIDPAYLQHSTFGRVVLSWSNQDPSSVGTLTLWTAAGGAHTVASASPGHTGAASPDGSAVLWADNATPATMDLFVGDPTGGNKHATALTGVSNDAQSCPLNARFAGGKFFVSTCAPDADGGISATADVSTIDPATGNVVQLATGVRPGSFVVDAAGSQVMWIDPGNDATVKVVGGATIPVDTAGDFNNGFFTADGNAVVLLTGGGALDQVVLAGPTTSTLVAAPGASVLQGISPLVTHVLYSSTVSANDGTADLWLLPLDGGAPTQLSTSGAVTGGGFNGYGDSWTSDDAYALYFDNVGMNGTGTVHAVPTAGGAEQASFSGVYYVFAASGAKLAFNDGYTPAGTSGRADVKVIDLSAPAAPMLVATRAELGIQVSASGSYVLYDFFAIKGQEAAYAFKIP